MRMCSRVSKAASSQGQAVGSFGMNLALYSPMGSCPKMPLVALAHRVMECTNCDSQVPPVGRARPFSSHCQFKLSITITLLRSIK